MLIDKELMEMLAEKVHERWMEKRTLDGWVYGPNRNDLKKEHPGMIPYAELEEREKDYDRATVEQVLSCLKDAGLINPAC